MIGITLSHYRITAKLGEGGMGEVYLAEDTELDRQVALKLLPQEMAEDPERLERFRREAKAVAALNHPNIITIHSIEEADGYRFLTMELVEGDSLDRVIPAEGLPLPRIFDIAVPVAEALTAAHERGIVHRDLKPANVMVAPDGRVKVLDFGLAKIALEATPPSEEAATEAALTGEGTVMGTAPYMSPEQLQGHAVDHRTDIFSLGILLYEMATGQRPFQGDSGIALASSILKDTPSTVTDKRTGLPRHFGRIVSHCLEKEPRRRFQSALDVRNELDSLRDEVESGASSVIGPPVSTGASAPQAVSSGPVDTGAREATAPRTAPEAAVTSGPISTTSGTNVGKWIGVAAVLLVVAGVAWWMGRSAEKTADSPTETETRAAESATIGALTTSTTRQALGPSVAVLPFADMSPNGDQEYFTDGLTIELINQLSQISDLRVTGRRSAFQFKDSNESLQRIGEQLKVGAILEGSVRKVEDRVRITTELVNAGDGFQLWSETYDRTLEDIFTIQDEIAHAVAQALEVTLLGKSTSGRAASLEAHNMMLQAQYLMARSEIQSTREALAILEEAISIDSESARLWAEHGLAQMRLGFASQTRDERNAYMEGALDSLNKALRLDSDLAEAHSRIGWIEMSYRADVAAAEVATRRALDLAPNNPVVLSNAATVWSALGRIEETIAFDQQVMSIEPMDLTAKSNAAWHYLTFGRLEAAETLIREVLRLNPDYYRARGLLGDILLAKGESQSALQEFLQEGDASYKLRGKAMVEIDLGDQEAADRSLAEFIESHGDEQPYDVATLYAYRGGIDEAFRWLEVADDRSAPGLPYLKVDYRLVSLHDDPRWPAFLDRLGLED